LAPGMSVFVKKQRSAVAEKNVEGGLRKTVRPKNQRRKGTRAGTGAPELPAFQGAGKSARSKREKCREISGPDAQGVRCSEEGDILGRRRAWGGESPGRGKGGRSK